VCRTPAKKEKEKKRGIKSKESHWALANSSDMSFQSS
jgi:hypothetical protein